MRSVIPSSVHNLENNTTCVRIAHILSQILVRLFVWFSLCPCCCRAPEFWDRNRQGELRYHCQVDVFAAGLTFLAMLQHNPSWGRCLTPHIETAKDDSEKYQSIGALLVERHKYQISERRARLSHVVWMRQ